MTSYCHNAFKTQRSSICAWMLRCASQCKSEDKHTTERPKRCATRPRCQIALHYDVCWVSVGVGAVLVLELIRSEESEVLAACLAHQIKDEHRAQTVSVATDQPSRNMCLAMRSVFCNLRFLFLDPVHLVIVYNQAHWRKWTQGESLLRVMMNKFNKLDSGKNAEYWGAPFANVKPP